MEQKSVIRLNYNRRALHDIDTIEQYIFEKGYPETAVSYTNRIIAYIKTLKQVPGRNSPCKFPAFKRRGYHCAIFENTYVIVYQIAHEMISIKRIIHGKRLNY